MKIFYKSLLTTLGVLAILSPNTFSQSVFTWETIPVGSGSSSAVSYAETRDGVTATVTSPRNQVYALNANGFGGSSGVIVYGTYHVDGHLTITFSKPINISTIFVVNGNAQYLGKVTLTPTGGNNIAVTYDETEVSKNVAVNWNAVTSFKLSQTTTSSSMAVDAITFTPINTLPVRLASYHATVDRQQTRLQWSSASESENQGYDIYRSGDDRRFVKIGTVPGNGRPSNYFFVDSSPLAGNNYYKLVQVDLDGSSTELGEKVLNFSFNSAVVSIYPNPTANLLNVRIADRRYHSAHIIDATGKQMSSHQITDHLLQIDISNYAKGTYFIRFSGQKGSEGKKFLVQ